MKTLISFLLFFATCSCVANNTGFLIYVSSNKHTSVHKVNTPVIADSIVARYTNNCFIGFSTKNFMRCGNFVELRTQSVHIYIEKKIIIKTRRGKLRWKKIK